MSFTYTKMLGTPDILTEIMICSESNLIPWSYSKFLEIVYLWRGLKGTPKFQGTLQLPATTFISDKQSYFVLLCPCNVMKLLISREEQAAENYRIYFLGLFRDKYIGFVRFLYLQCYDFLGHSGLFIHVRNVLIHILFLCRFLQDFSCARIVSTNSVLPGKSRFFVRTHYRVNKFLFCSTFLNIPARALSCLQILFLFAFLCILCIFLSAAFCLKISEKRLKNHIPQSFFKRFSIFISSLVSLSGLLSG